MPVPMPSSTSHTRATPYARPSNFEAQSMANETFLTSTKVRLFRDQRFAGEWIESSNAKSPSTSLIAGRGSHRWHLSAAREQEWVMKITSINPATAEAINTYDEMTPEEVASSITQSHEVWQSWRTTTFAERAELIKKTATILRERSTELARLMAAEMGKPLKQGIAEVE